MTLFIAFVLDDSLCECEVKISSIQVMAIAQLHKYAQVGALF